MALRAVGAVLLVQVSAGNAGSSIVPVYAGGGMDYFQQSVPRFVGAYKSHLTPLDERKYVAASAVLSRSQWGGAGGALPAALPASTGQGLLLAEETARDRTPAERAAARIGATAALEGEAAGRAEAAISELMSWVADLEADRSAANVSAAVDEAAQTFGSQRRKLLEGFDATVTALTSKSLPMTNRSAASQAFRTAQVAMDELGHLDREEAATLLAKVSSLKKEGQARARTLREKAKSEARQVYKLGKTMAQEQREANLPERVYEATTSRAERVKEDLERRAEDASERAVDLVERHTRLIQDRLERAQGTTEAAQDARERSLQLAARTLSSVHALARAAGSAAPQQPAAPEEQAASKTPAEPRTLSKSVASASGIQDAGSTSAAAAQRAAARIDATAALEDQAVDRAKATIKECHAWVAELEADRNAVNISAAVDVVKQTFGSQRAKVLEGFDTAVTALALNSLLSGNHSATSKAFNAARQAMNELGHLDGAETMAVRAKVTSLEKEGRVRARALRDKAKSAAWQVYKLGNMMAREQREANLAGPVYRATELRTSRLSEALERQAEDASGRAEDLVRRHFELVRDSLDRLQLKNEEAQRARERRVLQLERAVEGERGQQSSPWSRLLLTGDRAVMPGAASASTFLARRSAVGPSNGALVLLTGIAAVAALAAAVVPCRRRRNIYLEHPLLC